MSLSFSEDVCTSFYFFLRFLPFLQSTFYFTHLPPFFCFVLFRNAKLQGLFSEYFISFAPVFWVDLAFSFSFYFQSLNTFFFSSCCKQRERKKKKAKELFGVLYPSPNICTLFNPTDCCDGFFPKKNTLLGCVPSIFIFRISCICDVFCERMQIS